jgi:tRNA(Ile)-lysidine synthase
VLDAAVHRFNPRLPLAIAFSGGADSTALLMACAHRWPGRIRAIHVHHGLQKAADGFEAHCRAMCRSRSIPLHVVHVDARAKVGESPENVARQVRYASLRQAMRQAWPQDPALDIALAQHADDQVETLLLALSRGAGLPGIASMRPQWIEDGIAFHRPLLKVQGVALREWLVQRGIAWIEDPTNQDEDFTRNRIRARVMPALAQALPGFRATFARTAAHAAQAQVLLDEVAAEDLLASGCPPSIAWLRQHGKARRANLLRHWLRASHATSPSTAQLEELDRQIEACATRAHQISIKVGAGFVQRSGGNGPVLDWYNSEAS